MPRMAGGQNHSTLCLAGVDLLAFIILDQLYGVQLHRDTILRLLVLAGERCIALMDTQMRNLHCQRIQSDEIWSFIGKKQRHVKVDDPDEIGDAWVFMALDADTKLIPAYAVGKRNRETTYQFLTDLRGRMAEGHRFRSRQTVSFITVAESRMCSRDRPISRR